MMEEEQRAAGKNRMHFRLHEGLTSDPRPHPSLDPGIEQKVNRPEDVLK
jgi:hypothetical protein